MVLQSPDGPNVSMSEGDSGEGEGINERQRHPERQDM